MTYHGEDIIGEIKHFVCHRRPCAGEPLQTNVTFDMTFGNVTLAQDKDSVVGDIFYRLDEDLLPDAVDYIIAHLPAYVDTTAYAHFDLLLTRSHLERQMQQNRHGGEYISVEVNNAGIRRNSVLALMPESDWHRVLDVTLSGFYNVTQPLLPAMQLHKFGRIVNMASVSGLKGLPGQTNYSAAKGGIIAATKALAQEVARRNYRKRHCSRFHQDRHDRRA